MEEIARETVSTSVHGDDTAICVWQPITERVDEMRSECRDAALPGRMVSEHGEPAK